MPYIPVCAGVVRRRLEKLRDLDYHQQQKPPTSTSTSVTLLFSVCQKAGDTSMQCWSKPVHSDAGAALAELTELYSAVAHMTCLKTAGVQYFEGVVAAVGEHLASVGRQREGGDLW